jgi:hypothetical protein
LSELAEKKKEKKKTCGEWMKEMCKVFFTAKR